MKVIAVDFDGTLCKSMWPEIGAPNLCVIRELLRRQAEGDKLILWTCRRGELLTDAVDWCETFGLRFDAVNENLPERIAEYGDDTRKVSADEYWDDKSVMVGMRPHPYIVKDNGDGFDVKTWGTATVERVNAPSIRERFKEWLKKCL